MNLRHPRHLRLKDHTAKLSFSYLLKNNIRPMLKHLLFTSLLCLAFAVRIDAQSCGNDEKYHLPYKNTYVKEPLVTENEYRVAKPQVITPKSFTEARQILPNPIWAGHPKEIEMYWRAWEIAVGNIRAPQEGSGFVSSYLDTAYNGNIFMWDSSFILMSASRRLHLPRDQGRRRRLLRAL